LILFNGINTYCVVKKPIVVKKPKSHLGFGFVGLTWINLSKPQRELCGITSPCNSPSVKSSSFVSKYKHQTPAHEPKTDN